MSDPFSNFGGSPFPSSSMGAGVKLAIGAVIAAIIIVPLLRTGLDASGDTHAVAQKAADTWIASARINARAICVYQDTDNDGYVSCPMVITDPQGDQHTEPFECAGTVTFNQGCRIPKPWAYRPR